MSDCLSIGVTFFAEQETLHGEEGDELAHGWWFYVPRIGETVVLGEAKYKIVDIEWRTYVYPDRKTRDDNKPSVLVKVEEQV